MNFYNLVFWGLLTILFNCKEAKSNKQNQDLNLDSIVIKKEEKYSFPNPVTKNSQLKYYRELILQKFIVENNINEATLICENDNQKLIECKKCKKKYFLSISKIFENKIDYQITLKDIKQKIVSKTPVEAATEGNCFIYRNLKNDESINILSFSSEYWGGSTVDFLDIYSVNIEHKY